MPTGRGPPGSTHATTRHAWSPPSTRAGAALLHELRPWCARVRILAEGVVEAGRRILDGLERVGAVSKAIGVDTLKTVQYSATGFDYVLGQEPNPSAPWPKFIKKSYTRSIDFETPASRVDRVRLQGENPPRGGGQQPIIGEQSQSRDHRRRQRRPGRSNWRSG